LREAGDNGGAGPDSTPLQNGQSHSTNGKSHPPKRKR
jgi:hypothetical protein